MTVLNVECYDGDVIKVISANYGRRDTDVCPVDYYESGYYSNFYTTENVQCIYSNARSIVQNKSVKYFFFLRH